MDTEPLETIIAVGIVQTTALNSLMVGGGIVLLLLVSAFTSTAFASLLSVDPGEIAPFEETGENKDINRLRRMLRKPARTTLAIAGGAFISLTLGVLLMTLGLFYLISRGGIEAGIHLALIGLIAFLLSGFVFGLFGCLLPILLLAGTDFLIKNAKLIYLLQKALSPLVAIPASLANLTSNLAKLPEKLGMHDLNIYETTAAEEEELEHREKEMISAIFEMGEKTAKEIMTPRVDIIAIDAEDEPEKILSEISEAPYSRFPVYSHSIDNIIGILHIRNLMKAIAKNREMGKIEDILAPAMFVPESKPIDELLHDLQRDKTHMAIVSDEYGGVSGLVTIEDILEEIVGEIHDEYDMPEAELIQKNSDGSFVVNAIVSIDEFNEITGVNIDSDEYDTIGGLLYAKFGKIPKKGDVVYFAGVKFTILLVERNRIRLVQAELDEEVG